jgi:hypothetical protein
MLNLEETLLTNTYYVIQRDLYLKAFLYSFGVFTFIEIVRSQIAEIDLLQLIPGFYLILVFVSFTLLVIFSDLLFRIPVENDNNKSLGTKTINKIEAGILMKFSLFLFVSCLLISLNTIIPLSLDSFNSYGEKTLENIWSFDEVINIETILLIILLSVSQLPIFALASLSTDKDINILPEFWKVISIFIFIVAGFLTPTIDGYTQLSFSFSAISLYIIVINLILKRVNIKYNSLNTLSF